MQRPSPPVTLFPYLGQGVRETSPTPGRSSWLNPLGGDLKGIYAPIMPDISYFEAWGMWFDGRSALGNDLLGIPMIWWGRAGKILSFVSGAAIVVDLVGSEKLAHYGRRLEKFVDLPRRGFLLGFALGVLGGIAGSAVAIGSGLGALWGSVITIACATVASTAGIALFPKLLTSPQLALGSRWTALALFAVGFHFDLLAS